jgi:hypothetical protein
MTHNFYIITKGLKMIKKHLLIFFVAVLVLSLMSSITADEVGSYKGILGVSAGQGKFVITGPGESPQHYCGNNILESYLGEQCDGTDLGSNTCESLLGQDYSGSLSCKNDCTFDISDCSISSIPGPQPAESVGSGGGSNSRNKSCVENWQCTEWSECKDGIQTRECIDMNDCRTTKIKPVEDRTCTVEGEEGEAGVGLISEEKEEEGFTNKILGAVIGGSAKAIIPLVFIILIVIIAIVLYLKKSSMSW